MKNQADPSTCGFAPHGLHGGITPQHSWRVKEMGESGFLPTLPWHLFSTGKIHSSGSSVPCLSGLCLLALWWLLWKPVPILLVREWQPGWVGCWLGKKARRKQLRTCEKACRFVPQWNQEVRLAKVSSPHSGGTQFRNDIKRKICKEII